MADHYRGEKALGAVDQTAARSRTTAAGRDLLNAIHADLLDLRRRAKERRQRRQSADDRQAVSEEQPLPSKILRRALVGVATLSIAAVVAIAGLIFWSLHNLPLDQPNAARAESAIVLEAADGTPLGRVGTLKTADAERSDFPKHLVDAVVSVEDRRFYSHRGVDPRGIFRAFRRNMKAGTIVEGGSTITQQLVRLLYLGSERTYTRKLQEAITAVWLEGRLSKDEILTRYLNNVYLGANARGMPAAARIYFDKDLAELTLAESAMLAGLIRAPSQLNPLRDLQVARQRANVVLDTMVENGVLSDAEAEEARAEPAELNRPPAASEAGSWFADWAVGEASKAAGSFNGNLKVRTTLVPELQTLAEATVEEFLEAGAAHSISQAALVAMRPDGAVVAMVGGRDYRASQFNRAAQALRQPGSAFKLFVYFAALRNGYRPRDVIDAGPVKVDGWEPENFGGGEYGAMTLADAFAKSINTASARLALDVGLEQVIAAARDLGIDAPLAKHPSIALGAAEVSLIDLTGAYASVRLGRMPVEPFGIAAFGGEGQSRLYAITPSEEARKPLGEYQGELTELLQRVVRQGTGRQAALDGFAAGKTGTSEKHRDAWFIGFTEDLVAGVWVGNDDGAPMDEVTGGSLPALIWQKFMTGAKPLVREHGAAVASANVSADPDWAFDLPDGAVGPQSCDILACSAKYRSFRAEDCTYQPYFGGRRLCAIGQEPGAEPLLAEALEAINDEPLTPPPDTIIEPLEPDSFEAMVEPPEEVAASSEPETSIDDMNAAAGACDIAACAAKYNSFSAADCTFQPYGGGSRQLCEIGPGGGIAINAPAEIIEPLPEPAPRLVGEAPTLVGAGPRIVGAVPETGEPIVIIEEGSAEVAPPSACNVAACAAHYSSFRAEDCTYQPYEGGPRRYCER